MNLTKNEFIKIYEEKSIREISEEFSISLVDLGDWMKENGILLKNKKDIAAVASSRTEIFIDENELREKFINENLSRKQCAEYFCCSEALIKKKCHMYGIKKSPKNSSKNTRKTLLERYGTDNLRVLKAKEIEATNMKRYGGKSPFHNLEVQKKAFKSKEPSSLEQKAMDIFIENDIIFEKEYFIEKYKTRLFLVFDFCIFDKKGKVKGFIEVDGEFHNPHFFGEEEVARKREADEIKNEYCLQKKIPLLRIKPTDNFELKIMKFIGKIM